LCTGFTALFALITRRATIGTMASPQQGGKTTDHILLIEGDAVLPPRFDILPYLRVHFCEFQGILRSGPKFSIGTVNMGPAEVLVYPHTNYVIITHIKSHPLVYCAPIRAASLKGLTLVFGRYMFIPIVGPVIKVGHLLLRPVSDKNDVAPIWVHSHIQPELLTIDTSDTGISHRIVITADLSCTRCIVIRRNHQVLPHSIVRDHPQPNTHQITLTEEC
jgi:hypothetical protein